jgi:hypothetical protein
MSDSLENLIGHLQGLAEQIDTNGIGWDHPSPPPSRAGGRSGVVCKGEDRETFEMPSWPKVPTTRDAMKHLLATPTRKLGTK